jgi:hypothetical protein
MPSRGLIHSRTVAQVLKNVASYEVAFFFTHNLPIPDCFNELTKMAIEWEAEYIWFVEEDMSLYSSVLDDLLALEDPIATVDYPVVESNPQSVISLMNGYTICGTGCTLVNTRVFKELGYPYWRSNTRDARTLKIIDMPVTYGGHDVDFCIRAQDLGYTVGIIRPKVGQYRITEFGKYETNDGSHQIMEMKL